MKNIEVGDADQCWRVITREISAWSCESFKHVLVYGSVQPLAGKLFVSMTDPANVELFKIPPAVS
jgi:hypothetical protein